MHRRMQQRLDVRQASRHGSARLRVQRTSEIAVIGIVPSPFISTPEHACLFTQVRALLSTLITQYTRRSDDPPQTAACMTPWRAIRRICGAYLGTNLYP